MVRAVGIVIGLFGVSAGVLMILFAVALWAPVWGVATWLGRRRIR